MRISDWCSDVCSSVLPLDALGFHLTGFGCMTCMGNSGPLQPEIAKAIEGHDVTATAVLSGNRNFEGRIHPLARTNYIGPPPLAVAYALAGSRRVAQIGRGAFRDRVCQYV